MRMSCGALTMESPNRIGLEASNSLSNKLCASRASKLSARSGNCGNTALMIAAESTWADRYNANFKHAESALRSDERSGGKECVRKCRCRWLPYIYQNQK